MKEDCRFKSLSCTKKKKISVVFLMKTQNFEQKNKSFVKKWLKDTQKQWKGLKRLERMLNIIVKALTSLFFCSPVPSLSRCVASSLVWAKDVLFQISWGLEKYLRHKISPPNENNESIRWVSGFDKNLRAVRNNMFSISMRFPADSNTRLTGLWDSGRF